VSAAISGAGVDPIGPDWDELVTVALVGTERRPLPAAVAPDGTPLAGAGLDRDEARVLAAAAVLAPWRAAGWRPAEDGGHPSGDPADTGVERGEITGRVAPAPPDERPVCSARAAQVLDLLLVPGTTFADPRGLILHWLTCAAAGGVRPPHRQLLPLLARATADGALRPGVAAVVDQRGRWLAAQRPDWAWVLVKVDRDPSAWATAGRAERLDLLRALRATDPGTARRLLEDDVATLPAAERAELVEALATGLGPEDEPLLESLLDDRARTVRMAAAALLDRLPASRRGERLAAALTALIGVSGRVRRRVEVDLPAEDAGPGLDRDLPGDARVSSPLVVALAGQLGLGNVSQGRRAARLRRLVAAAPLSTWGRAGFEPAAVIAAAEDRPELVVGLAAAVVAQADHYWAAALFARLPLPLLVPLVPPAIAEARLGLRVARATDTELSPVLVAAGAIAEPWTAGFSATVVDRARAVRVPHVMVAWRDLLAERLDPSVLPAVEAWIAATDTDGLRPLHRQVRQLHQALSMRRTITEELRGAP
jgi:hypothetical protein